MMNYKNMLNSAVRIIKSGREDNWIIIGDNSSGKSELLKKLLDEMDGSVYYIDSVNRYININEINTTRDGIHFAVTSNEIIETRKESKHFNLKDSFGKNEHIERFFPLYEERLRLLLKDFLGINFEVKLEELDDGFGDGDIKVFIDGQNVELSSGYQAIIRIFSEILFYTEIIEELGIIVIDELDEFLSPRHASKILEFLKTTFSNNNFIVSTHSSDLICGTNQCKIVVLEESNYQLLDSDDFVTLTDVNTLFQKVFGKTRKERKMELDEQLERLLQQKLLRCWGEEEKTEFAAIEVDELSLVQKVIYNQIRSWE